MNSIKEAIGIFSWWDLPEAIWGRERGAETC